MLSDIQILQKLVSSGDEEKIVISPMIRAREQIGPSSVNVHLGTDFSVVERSNRERFDPLMSLEEYEEWLKHARLIGRYSILDPFILHPFQFALASTLEFISLGKRIVGHIDGRSSWARQGLRVHSTAANIHPGSSGFVVFEFNNVGPVPILLYPGMAIAQLTFEELSVPVSEKYCDRANSQYSGFRQTLWSGYPQDSILQAMRNARKREAERVAKVGAEHGAQRRNLSSTPQVLSDKEGKPLRFAPEYREEREFLQDVLPKSRVDTDPIISTIESERLSSTTRGGQERVGEDSSQHIPGGIHLPPGGRANEYGLGKGERYDMSRFPCTAPTGFAAVKTVLRSRPDDVVERSLAELDLSQPIVERELEKRLEHFREVLTEQEGQISKAYSWTRKVLGASVVILALVTPALFWFTVSPFLKVLVSLVGVNSGLMITWLVYKVRTKDHRQRFVQEVVEKTLDALRRKREPQAHT